MSYIETKAAMYFRFLLTACMKKKSCKNVIFWDQSNNVL